MKYVIVTKDQDIAAAAKSPSAFPPGDEISVFSEWLPALDACQKADLMFVDMLSTLREPHKIGGYEEFAHAKMSHPVAKGTPLVVIAVPDDYEMDFMAGFPDFVFAHLRRPVTDKIFRRASTWV